VTFAPRNLKEDLEDLGPVFAVLRMEYLPVLLRTPAAIEPKADLAGDSPHSRAR
jgi:hypothetical protein